MLTRGFGDNPDVRTPSATRDWRRLLAYLLAGVVVVWSVYAVFFLISVLDGAHPERYDPVPDLIQLVFVWGLVAVPCGLIGWLLLSGRGQERRDANE